MINNYDGVIGGGNWSPGGGHDNNGVIGGYEDREDSRDEYPRDDTPRNVLGIDRSDLSVDIALRNRVSELFNSVVRLNNDAIEIDEDGVGLGKHASVYLAGREVASLTIVRFEPGAMHVGNHQLGLPSEQTGAPSSEILTSLGATRSGKFVDWASQLRVDGVPGADIIGSDDYESVMRGDRQARPRSVVTMGHIARGELNNYDAPFGGDRRFSNPTVDQQYAALTRALRPTGHSSSDNIGYVRAFRPDVPPISRTIY